MIVEPCLRDSIDSLRAITEGDFDDEKKEYAKALINVLVAMEKASEATNAHLSEMSWNREMLQ